MAGNAARKRPKHLGRTLRRLLRYLGKHRLALAAVALLVIVLIFMPNGIMGKRVHDKI